MVVVNLSTTYYKEAYNPQRQLFNQLSQADEEILAAAGDNTDEAYNESANQAEYSPEKILYALKDTVDNLGNQDTASYQQSSSGSGANVSPQQPCPSPKTVPLIELMISDSMNRLYDGYTSGSATWDAFSTAVFDGINFDKKECGCYVSILSLSDLIVMT